MTGITFKDYTRCQEWLDENPNYNLLVTLDPRKGGCALGLKIGLVNNRITWLTHVYNYGNEIHRVSNYAVTSLVFRAIRG